MITCRSVFASDYAVLVISACFASLPLPLSGQADTASVSGVVLDAMGAQIPGAQLTIHSVSKGTDINASSNKAGVFTLIGLLPGSYDLTIAKEGFAETKLQNILLNVGDQKALQITLKIGSADQVVNVDASGLTLNTTDASVGTVIDRKFVENIPLNGRSFQDLISMTPGVVTQSPQAGSGLNYNGDFSVNGQRTESNYYTIDGVTGNIGAGNGYGYTQNATGGTMAGTTALGTTQSLVSVDALQEFKVQSSTYSAEYGRSPGGQFSLVTRSGTNQVHGTVFDYLRNNYFDANDWFNDYYSKPTPALRQNDFGGTLGGPVWIPKLYNGENRTFIFGSYEGLRLSQPTAATVWYVPDTYMRQQAPSALQGILNAYPIQNGLDYGSSTSPSLAQYIAAYSLPSKIDSTSVRVDHTVRQKLLLFFRYAGTPSSSSSRPYMAFTKNSTDVHTYTLGATSQLLRSLNNDFRLGYDRTSASIIGTSDNIGGATPINLSAAVGTGAYSLSYPVIVLNFTNIGSTSFGTANGSNISHQWNLVDTSHLSIGHHQVSFGIDFRRTKSPSLPADPQTKTTFKSTQSILNNAPDTPFVARYVSATPVFNETSLFIQDEWRLHPNLGLSVGVRWEINPAPHEAHGNDAYTLLGSIGNPSSLSLAPKGTPLWNTAWYSFAPRMGAAWTAHEQPGWETVVRAGGGVFFDTVNQVATLGYTGIGFSASKTQSGASLPYTSAQLNVPISTAAPYTTSFPAAFPSHMQLPYTLEWNVSVQQALGKAQAITISYVGANGRRLIARQQLSVAKFNPNFATVFYFPSGITSNYQALQAQFQRSISHGVQALASYTWSHSLDYGSISTTLPIMRGNSDFDVRYNFQSGLSWELPKISTNKIIETVANNWAVDGRLMTRGGFPVPLRGSTYTDPATGNVSYLGLNMVANQPIYLYGGQYPGGRIINKAAFSVPATGVSGDAPRNFVRGFGAMQINLAVRRELRLHESLKLQFRAETFNILNHPNFGYIDPTYSDAQFGQTTQMLNQSLGTVASQYQQGGPRSMQFALKLLF